VFQALFDGYLDSSYNSLKKGDVAVSKQYYSVEEIANILEVSIDTVRNWIKQGRLEAFKVGRDYRISQEQFDRFMNERRTRKDE
jgi:excisionase family DNA binding protein